MLCLCVAIGMQICNGLKTFLHESILGQPTRSLGEEERHEHENSREDDLNDEWSLPRHGLWEQEMKPVVDPARQHVSRNQASILDADHHASSVRCCNLGLNDRDSHGEETNADTLDCASGNKGGEIWSKDLDKGAEEVDEATKADSPLSANHIAESAGNEGSHSSGGLQTGDGDTSDGRTNFSCAAVGAAIITEEALDKDWIDKQPRHDTWLKSITGQTHE